jgi:hypothetical protein
MRKTLLAIAMLCASGCYSYQLRKPSPLPVEPFGLVPDDASEICVVRPHWIAAAVTAVVHDNQVLVGATRGPTYFCYFADPGRHVIVSRADGTQEATLEAAPGRRYYLHQIVDNIAGWVRTRLAWVDEAEARPFVEKCGYRIIVAVPGDQKLPDGANVPSLSSITRR